MLASAQPVAHPPAPTEGGFVDAQTQGPETVRQKLPKVGLYRRSRRGAALID
jgi:hypothetical protein